jgi:enterochelin esterase family protein
VGSFVDLRGGNAYPSLIRITERKPLRVYLLDGENDLDNPYGNWPLANKQMAAALKFMNYDFRMDWNQCFHGSKGMAPVLPDALRWLWRDVR